MDWARDLPDWPHTGLSRQVRYGPHLWHVQETGHGPTVLLLHGAGSSTHTWRDLIPLLARDHRVIALDMPGQGFTRAGTKSRCGLEAMTADIAALCTAEGWHPNLIVGHSAGAAVALSLAMRLGPDVAVTGINAALDRFDGVAGWLFPLLAKLLALNPFTPVAFTAGGNPSARARRLIESTGSALDDVGISFYARLIADRAHVEGTLQMMAQWNIDALAARLSEITAPVLFLVGDRDRAVAPKVSARAANSMPNATLVHLPKLGHLAHEEDPGEINRQIRDWTVIQS